ncbi:MAG: ATP-binding cassette domain-containing protein [Proteobacteria bacterium]|nr:ATP-binding cassette domain-containing protein [Pseudomonadota bacterium]
MRQTRPSATDPRTFSVLNDSKNAEGKKHDLRPLRSLLPFLAPYRREILLAFVALVVASATVLSMGVALKAVVDKGFATGSAEQLNQSLIVLLVLIGVMACATFTRFSMVSWIGERLVADLRLKMFGHLLELSPSFFESAAAGDLVSRMNTDTNLLQTVVGSSLSVALRNFLLLVGGTAMLLFTSPRMTGFVFLLVPVVIAPILIFGRRVRRLSKISQEKLADVSIGLEETIHGIRTIQAFVREAEEHQGFAFRVHEAFVAAIERIRARAWMTVAVITLVFGGVAFVLWLGGRDVLAHRMTAGQLSAFIFYAVLVAGAVGAVTEVLGDLQRASGATERILELMAVQPDIVAYAHPMPLPHRPRGELDFQHVSFFYPSRPQAPALDHFHLHVRPGERIALVGPSGAGKSTVFQLLLRFYDPQAGLIRLDNVDLKETDPKELRRLISFVPQDVAIFSTDALTNIRMAKPEASDEEVKRAATAANAHDFIAALPQGYRTYLGEKGIRLSGGQRQRIGIARAALRQTPLLLLDEATSALDSQSEKAVQEALAQLMQDRTTLIIAHRLSTIRHCDRIVVMDRGLIIEEGTHDALLEQQGLYAKLSRLQFRA